MNLSQDTLAILLLCSHLGLSPATDFSPLALKEWNDLARKLQTESMRPGDLLNQGIESAACQLVLTEKNAERVSKLLLRRTSLEIELGRLERLGIQVMTRADANYPERYRQRLKDAAPVILFYSGEKALLGQPGIAVVGSRHLDVAGETCAEFVGNACGMSGLVLYSGGAKGVDSLSMRAALGARGTAVGILSDNLEKAVRDPENRNALQRGDLCLATPYSPNAPFSVGTAMGRNKLIYALADHAIVVASDFEKGGTWAGATEALRAKWIPVFALDHPEMPEGNRQLIQKGALPFPHPFQAKPIQLLAWLEEHAAQVKPASKQPALF